MVLGDNMPVEMDEKEIVSFVMGCFREAEAALKPIHNSWTNYWNLYRHQQDYSEKEDWQTQVFYPKTYDAVRQATSLIRRAWKSQRPAFAFQSVAKSGDRVADVITKVMDYYLNMRDVHFERSIFESLEPAFVTGFGGVKLYFKTTQQRRLVPQKTQNSLTFVAQDVPKSNLVVEPVYPWDMFPDPRGKLFIVQRVKKSLHELMDQSDQYIRGSLDDVMRRFGSKDLDAIQHSARMGFADARTSQRSEITLYEYWGALLDKDKNLYKRNQIVTVAEGDILLRLQDNPFLHGRNPFVLYSPMPVPFRGDIGQGIVEPAETLQKFINEILNMQGDALKFSLLKMFRIDPNILFPEDVERFWPGKYIRGEHQQIEMMNMGNVPPESFAVLGNYERFFDTATGITPFVTGGGNVKGQPTMGEVQMKLNQSLGFFRDVGEHLEANFLAPALKMAWELMLQYMDFLQPPIARVMKNEGIDLSELNVMQRAEIIYADADVNAYGISAYFKKENEAQVIERFLRLFGRSPELIQASGINLAELVRTYTDAIQLPNRDVIVPPMDPKVYDMVERMKALKARQGGAGAPMQKPMMPAIGGM